MTELISVQQLAEKINFAPRTIYRWVSDRRIPFVKMPGNDIRFDKQKIESWIENRTVKSKNIGQ
jgi:excisionase family DNA binding protein